MRDWKCSRTEVIEWWVVYNLLKAFRLRPDDGNGASGAEEIKTGFPLFPFLSSLSLSPPCSLFRSFQLPGSYIVYTIWWSRGALPSATTHREDHTSFRVMPFLFQLPRLRLGLRFRIKRRHKSSSLWVAVEYKDLRFLFISKIRQKLTPTQVL